MKINRKLTALPLVSLIVPAKTFSCFVFINYVLAEEARLVDERVMTAFLQVVRQLRETISY
jgi:hypothetical protein